MTRTAPPRRRPSRLKKAALQLATAVLVLAGVELVLRLAGFGAPDVANDPYVGFVRSARLFVPDDDGVHLVTAPERRNHFNLQRFPARKAPGTVRIFALGGSTTYGHPYTDATSFPGWLREFLREAHPATRYEVVNAGGISYASYRVAVLVQELCEYEPDLFVLYTGHNEFLEERTYGAVRKTPHGLLRLGHALRDTATFDALAALTGHRPPAAQPYLLGAEAAPLLDRSVGPAAYHRDDAQARAILGHLEHNLVRMAALARRAGATLLLVTPASQLADCAPFKSEHTPGLAAAQRADVAAVLAAARDDPAAARARLEQAAGLDPRHALVWYRLGQAREAQGDARGAREAYVRARDEDIVPLRALSETIEIVRRVAAREDLPLVDAVAVVDRLAEARRGVPIPGSEVFLDHVHLTVEGYREIAQEILRALIEIDVVPRGTALAPAALARVVERVEATLTVPEQVRGLHRLAQVLDWAGKREEAAALNEQALALSGGDDPMVHWMAGNLARDRGEVEAALTHFREALAIDPEYVEAHHNLAALLIEEGRPGDALPHLRDALQLSPEDDRLHAAEGAALDALGRGAEARAAYGRALQLDPADADTAQRLGLSALRDGDTVLAEEAFRAAVAAAPGLARARYNLGVLLERSGRLDEAEQHLRAACAADAGHARARLHLARVLQRAGRDAEALSLLEQAARTFPTDDALQRELAEARARSR